MGFGGVASFAKESSLIGKPVADCNGRPVGGGDAADNAGRQDPRV